jgi:hypothetical protein
MLVPIVNDAPWIASVGVATFQFPILDAAAKGFKAPYLCAFGISPVIAGRWRHSNHIAETLSSMASSSYGRPGTLERERHYVARHDNSHVLDVGCVEPLRGTNPVGRRFRR